MSRRLGLCKWCGAEVEFARTIPGQKFMPLDPERHPADDESANVARLPGYTTGTYVRVITTAEPLREGEQRRMPHFATCPKYSKAPSGRPQERGSAPRAGGGETDVAPGVTPPATVASREADRHPRPRRSRPKGSPMSNTRIATDAFELDSTVVDLMNAGVDDVFVRDDNDRGWVMTTAENGETFATSYPTAGESMAPIRIVQDLDFPVHVLVEDA